MRLTRFLGILLLSLMFGLVGCNLDQEKAQDPKEEPNVSEENETDGKPDVTKEEPRVDEEETPPVNNSSTTPAINPDKPVSNPPGPSAEEKEKQYQNNAFMEVTINEGEAIVITGKARVFEGSFQYAVVSNGEVLKGGTYQTDGAPAWGPFEITVGKEYAKAGVVFELFVYSAKDGSKIDVLEIPLNKNERLTTK
jgi:hypothetical protein